MATVVTAIFENPDMADLALHQLRGHNIPLYSFHVQPVRETHAKRNAQPPPILFATAPLNIGGFNSSAFLPAPLTVPPAQGAAEAHEVIFTATIPDGDAARVRGILTNAHGRRVR